LAQYEENDASSRWMPVHRRIAEVDRTPSGSEKRATGDERVESSVGTKERVNGSLTIGVARARKRKGPSMAKGGRVTEARRSSSRERRVPGEGSAVSFVLRHEPNVRARLSVEGTLDRQSARLSRGPRRIDLGGLCACRVERKKSVRAQSNEEATRVSEAIGLLNFHAAEQNATA